MKDIAFLKSKYRAWGCMLLVALTGLGSVAV